MTNDYEITDLFEVGKAGSLIQDKPALFADEISGDNGPVQDALEDE